MYSDALLTDLYQLTMAAGYLDSGRADDTAVFELYFRQNPFHGGYAIAAGLEPAVRAVLGLRFNAEDLAFLRSLRSASGGRLFSDRFLDFLAGFRFEGDVRAAREGTVVFAVEPIVQVGGRLIDCQMVETILLCHVNYQTLVATKAARLWEASGHGSFAEFGLRRAPGPDGASSACRAAYIGGADSTSNVLAAARLGITARGTHAHSWVQAFSSELEAFRAFARSFPDDCILLVDTYDVLRSGVPNAITVARELEAAGHRLVAIRIDSGDQAFLSKSARASLDEAGLGYVKILSSSDLDEFVVANLLAQGGKIDLWGIGTNLVTGGGEGGGALGGVYKLVEHEGKPRIKLSSNPEKITNPGAKRVVRFYDDEGLAEGDALARSDEALESGTVLIIDPKNPLRRKELRGRRRVDVLEPIVGRGELVRAFPPLDEVRERRRDQLAHLHESHR
ncbi:MAG: nicotinate phosphoribosyltransferase, partial [Acidobacteria bacterium]